MLSLILILTLALSQVEENQAKVPLIVEISPDHPLFIFACELDNTDFESASEKINTRWNTLRDELKPYSTLQITFPISYLKDLGNLEDTLINIFSEKKIPFFLKMSMKLSRDSLPDPQEISALYARFPNLFGICVSDFSLNLYPSENNYIYPDFYQVEWLSSVINITSKYGRLVFLPMNSFELVRLLSHPKGAELLELIKSNPDNVIPSYLFDSDFAFIGLGALLGLYLGGYVNRVGIECSSDWYHRSYIVQPCMLGKAPPGTVSIYTPLYRGMILSGSLVGATAYIFPKEDSLWGGKESVHWTQTIENTLLQIIDLGLIPTKEMVRKRINAGYRCFPAGTSQEFWKVGEILFPQFGSGAMAEAIYGANEGKKFPDIIPEIGNNYILPLFPFKCSFDNDDMFIVGYKPVHPEWTWTDVIAKVSQQIGEGSAFITEVGKYLFVFNSSEHQIQRQSYKVTLPLSVRKFTASRVEGGIQLSWGFREGDVSYQIYRKYQPNAEYELVARGIEAHQWKDTTLEPSRAVSYSITALTTEQEVVEGFVNPGEYKVFSLVESRIAEEVMLLPEMNFAESVPIIETTQEVVLTCPDPSDPLSPDQKEIANSIKNSLVMMESAIIRKDVSAVSAIFSEDYKDPVSSGTGHIKYALLSFFNLVPSPKFMYQIRNFYFNSDNDGNVIVITPVFLKVLGYKISDELGIKSNILLEMGPSEDGETTISWCKKDSLWVIKSSEKPLLYPNSVN